jgi:hypothetical protein
MAEELRDDRIFPVTKIVAVIVIPFLVLAFIILFIFPHLSAERFSWEIKPSIMAAYMGSGYLGGAFLFVCTVFGRRWHQVATGFLAVTAFTWAMLLTTFLHWSRFDINHFPFQLWLILYVVTPFLVPWLWWRNRKTDPRQPEPGTVLVPLLYRLAIRLLGAAIIIIGILGFIWPNLLISVWPWQLTPLLARILAGWGALLGVGNLMISFEPRWSAWRVPVGSIALWHGLYLLGSWLYRQDFKDGAWFNWYNLSVTTMLILVGGLFVFFERKKAALAQKSLREA